MTFTRLMNEILPQASRFLGVFFVVMLFGYGVLYYIDFVPETPAEASEPAASRESVTSAAAPAAADEAPALPAEAAGDPYPVAIVIDRLDREVAVLNPAASNVATLDAALLKGAVRHPDSADLNDPDGNILILGHSSYLKTVFNKNYQAFNGIQNLTWGDTIRLRSNDTEYVYQVDRVYQDKASNITIPTRSDQPKLTLTTCNTFGTKEDRFVVEATLVSKKAL